MSKKLLIFGNGEIASIAYNCFVKYTKYKIDGFIVDEFANNQKTFLDKKLINIKDIGNYPPKEYDIFIDKINQKAVFGSWTRMVYHRLGFLKEPIRFIYFSIKTKFN